MKKIISFLLIFSMLVTLSSCQSTAPTNSSQKTDEKATVSKIGILTGTVSQGEEEFRKSEELKQKYPDLIINATYPDNFDKELETFISLGTSLVDQGAKAIIIDQAVQGTSAMVEKIWEKDPDILIIACIPGEKPEIISKKANIVLNSNEIGSAEPMVLQAKKMGAKTLVYYSFPRHKASPTIAKRFELAKEICEREGILFVDANCLDPMSEAGVAGAQQFIREDVPRKVAQYGKDTAFYSTNCGLQEPLIQMILKEKAIYPQQCCPSPYHAYPTALGISVPEDKKGDFAFMLQSIKEKVAENELTGRMSTWAIACNAMMLEVGCEYAKEYLEGTITSKNSPEDIKRIISETTNAPIEITNFVLEDQRLENYYLVLSDYITF